jgi:type II secretory pathway predicted ATPase ExeA
MSARYFNVAGPCQPDEHYILDPLRGIGDELMSLIGKKQYFIIHAARQSGKTTLLQELARQINAQGGQYALYCSLEAVQELTEPEKGIPEIVKRLERRVRSQGLPEGFAKNADYSHVAGVLSSALEDYCRLLDKPLSIFFDEADCLSNGTLITFLRQLREGYINRSDTPFVHSIALVGMRNIRDYKARIRPDSATLGSASPFNIVTKSFNLRNFTKDEVAQLYAQHTAETGQVFESQAMDCIFEQTQGQPWLVNAVAAEAVEEITRKDYSMPITKDLAEQAIQNIILARGTHFDSLMERLKEERVSQIIEPLILGEEADMSSDDYLYTRDLGLIRDDRGKTEPANPIYAEVIVRTLSSSVQKSVEQEYPGYTVPRYMKNGKIDMDFLIKDFQQFWRENCEAWKDRYKKHTYKYPEAAPHLLMHGFLQRVINGGGNIIRDMALGAKRADLCVMHDGQKYPIELKILQNEKSRADSLNQISGYIDQVGSDTGWLVIFDRDAKKSWEDRIYMYEESINGKRIVVAGC